MKYAIHFILLKCLLWQIDDNIYIFGVVHTIPEQQFVWTPVLDSVLHNSQQLYLEADITKCNAHIPTGYIFYEDTIAKMFNGPTKGFQALGEILALQNSLAPASTIGSQYKLDSTLYYWMNRDIYNLYRIAPYKEQTIDSRNRLYASQIETMDKPTFITVGASHLYTLLNMLRTSGHRTQPVYY